MAKLHELLAAEKTPTGAWNTLYEETLKKFKNPVNYFEGHSRSLSMIEANEANKATEAEAREEKPVTTTVYDTLEYALDIFGKAEDLQYQKNATNRKATGTVMFRGQPILEDMPVDELLGLEDRLKKLRVLYAEIPTLDGTQHWVPAPNTGRHVWENKFPHEKIKTEKTMTPVVLSPATKEHPAQVTQVPKDVTVGRFTTVKRSGTATASQKAESIKRIDELLIEVKQARMRANETVVESGKVSTVLLPLLLEALQTGEVHN